MIGRGKLRVRLSVGIAVLALTLAACSTSVDEYDSISMQALGSASGINFLPPVGDGIALSGNFDDGVDLTIMTFRLDNGQKVGPTFRTSDGSITVTDDPGVEEQYQANLDTSSLVTEDDVTVRVEVRSGPTSETAVCSDPIDPTTGCLAFFDLELWANKGQAKKTRSGTTTSTTTDEEIIDLVNGQTLPIKVHIAQGAQIADYGLVAHYSFDACDATDDTGHGHDGTLYGPAGTNIGGPACVDGVAGKALQFDGDDDRVEVPNDPDLVMSDAFTLAGFIEPVDAGSTTHGGIIGNKEGEYEIARYPDGEIRIAIAPEDSTAGWSWQPTGVDVQVGELVHLAWTFDAVDAKVRLYLNGTVAWEANHTTGTIGDISPDDNDFWIGARPLVIQYFDGVIDEVRLYDRALTADEVASLYAMY